MYDKITEIFRRDAEWRWRRSLPLILRDMVSVYGGFYGDKLSYESPKEVWEALRRSGISQIIDLRYDYHSEQFKSRCKAYGISYFSYLSNKDFLVKLPDHLHDNRFKANSEGEVFVYAWYDAEIDAIQVFDNTGNIREEQDTSPGYDGYGRFDRDYERVRGVIDANCQWKVKPYLSWGSLNCL